MNQVIVEPERLEIAPPLENLREKAQEIFSLLPIRYKFFHL